MPIRVKHGSMTMYSAHKCRCDLCRETARITMAAYRARLYEQGYVFNRGRLRRPKKAKENQS